MTNPNSEPTRLLDDPEIDGLLRRDLELAQAHAPIAYDATAGIARFEQALASASAGAGAGAGAVTTGRVLGWIVSAAVLVGGAGGASWVMSQAKVDHRVTGSATPAEGANPSPGDRASASDLAARGAHPAVAEDRPEPQADSSDPSTPSDPSELPDPSGVADVEDGAGSRTGSSSTPAQPAAKPPASAPAFASEAEAINAARKALATDPARALALIEAAEREFPSGALIQEREGYAILALIALDRRTEAQTRAAGYLERWPNGPLSRRVRDALAQ